MKNKLELAIESLAIKNVLLRNNAVRLDDTIFPQQLDEMETFIQSFREVQNIQETEVESGEQKWIEYSFFYAAGVRLVDDNKVEDPKCYLEITSTFNAIYRSNKKLNSEELDAFSENNVGYHVWPFWREFVQSSCNKLSIRPLEVPFYIVSNTKQTED